MECSQVQHRLSQISKEKAEKLAREQEIERKQRELKQKRLSIEAQIKELNTQLEAEKLELEQIIEQKKLNEESIENERNIISKIRHANGDK